MNRRQQAAVCRALRCRHCRRRPTAAEVNEMVENFGAKLKPGDGPDLQWVCYGCCDRKPVAKATSRTPAGPT